MGSEQKSSFRRTVRVFRYTDKKKADTVSAFFLPSWNHCLPLRCYFPVQEHKKRLFNSASCLPNGENRAHYENVKIYFAYCIFHAYILPVYTDSCLALSLMRCFQTRQHYMVVLSIPPNCPDLIFISSKTVVLLFIILCSNTTI